MIAWEPFKHGGNIYELSHLHPSIIQFIQPETAGQPTKTYTVEVCYSLHCFSKGVGAIQDPQLDYSDARETRSFDFLRYELSKQLPGIIQGLNLRKCMHTGNGNFFVVEIVLPNGIKQEYEVYFDVQRGSAADVAHLFVQSAFVRDPENANKRKSTKRISLYVILNNRLAGKPIKMPH